MYCVTKNGAARCAGHDTAIRLELRFFSRRCREEVEVEVGSVGPNDAISDPEGISKDGPSRVDKKNPVQPVDCRSSSRMKHTAATACPCICLPAHVNPDSRASFHKFLPADVLPRITARRFTAKLRVGKIVFTASGYTYGSYEDEEEERGRRRQGTASPELSLKATRMTSR